MPDGLGSIEAFIGSAYGTPLLEAADEKHLAQQLQGEGSNAASETLIASHLRLVISIARNYRGYGLPMEDLIQEGNVGLLKAVERFDPNHGVRLSSYASYWIRAEIHEYILRNWRLVKVATTKAQRKLFFNLRAFKANADAATLSKSQIDTLAAELDVKAEDVAEMEVRLAGADIALDTQDSEEGERLHPAEYLATFDGDPVASLERRYFDKLQTVGLAQALAQLDARSRRIVEARWLPEDGEDPIKLRELAEEFGVSMERIRQIEAKALQNMRTNLSAYAMQ